jgi:hypothetical protein
MSESLVISNTPQAAGQAPRHAPGRRPLRRWYWQAVLSVLLAVLAVEGQPVAASQTSAPSNRAAWTQRTTGTAQQASVQQADGAAQSSSAVPSLDDRPDLRVAFAPVGDVQGGQPFRWTIQVRNDGGATNAASISAQVPPELSNVRVTAPGFLCTRRFTASGPDAGTAVSCARSDLERGASADVTIEANAPAGAGSYHLTAVADPRDDVTEADEANNAADLTVEIHG